MIGLSENVSIHGRCLTLPSSDAAVTLVQGDIAPGVVGVVGSTLLRSVLIMGGLYAVGERKHLIRNSIGASVAIELFVLAWIVKKNGDSRSPSQSPTTRQP